LIIFELKVKTPDLTDMGKVSSADKMRIQTLHEQGYGAKRIVAAYLFKNWKLMTVKNICQIVDSRGSAELATNQLSRFY